MESKHLLKKLKILTLRSSSIADAMRSGSYRSVFKGRGFEFEEVRPYFYGDDARSIDWNVSARLNSPYIKLYREQRELSLFFMFDESFSMSEGTLCHEKACEVLTLLASACDSQGDRSGAVFFSGSIRKWLKPSRGRRHVLALIDEAALQKNHERTRGTDLDTPVRAALKSLKKRSMVFIISDFKAEQWDTRLFELARKHDVVAIRIKDTLNVKKGFGMASFIDPETHVLMRAPLASEKFWTNYEDYTVKADERFASFAKEKALDTCTIETTDDVVSVLLEFFKRRKH